MKRKKSDICFVTVFFAVLVSAAAAFFILPEKEFSDTENRSLAKAPSFSVKSLAENRFTSELESYLNDHMVLRDRMILLKNTADILTFDTENNDAIIGKDGFIFARNSAYTQNVPKVIEAVNSFAAEGFNVTMGIIPSSAEIYPDKLPKNSGTADEARAVREIYSRLDVTAADIVTALKDASSDTGLYFRTDHHLTADGAGVLYNALAPVMDWKDIDDKGAYIRTVSGFKGAYYRKFPNLLTQPEDFTFYDFPGLDAEINGVHYDTLTDEEKLSSFDKYAALVYGNNPLVIIRNPECHNGRRIAVFRDSYFNMLAPLAAQNYEEMYLIDLRSFTELPSEYLRGEGIDDVLILYSLSQLQADGGLALLDD